MFAGGGGCVAQLANGAEGTMRSLGAEGRFERLRRQTGNR